MLDELSELVKKLAVSRPQTTIVCGSLTSTQPNTDSYPKLQEDDGGYKDTPQAYVEKNIQQ